MKKNREYDTGSVSVCAVIVTYRPAKKRLNAVIDAVLPQVDEVLVIDNGSGETVGHGLPFESGKLGFTGLPENTGIAAAQNRGILQAKRRDFPISCFWIRTAFPTGLWSAA